MKIINPKREGELMEHMEHMRLSLVSSNTNEHTDGMPERVVLGGYVADDLESRSIEADDDWNQEPGQEIVPKMFAKEPKQIKYFWFKIKQILGTRKKRRKKMNARQRNRSQGCPSQRTR